LKKKPIKNLKIIIKRIRAEFDKKKQMKKHLYILTRKIKKREKEKEKIYQNPTTALYFWGDHSETFPILLWKGSVWT
jgi:hypothetical protein